MRNWMWNRLASLVESSIVRENERLKTEVRDRIEDLRIARHDLAVEQSRAEALEQKVEFLELSLDSQSRWVETLISRMGYETGKATG